MPPRPGRYTGAFLTRSAAPLRKAAQRADTGAPMFGRRKNFDFPSHWARMHKRVATDPALQAAPLFEDRFRSNGGIVATRPVWEAVDPLNEREDGVMATWEKTGRLQMHAKTRSEYFVCYKCGYPVKSRLVAVLDDNWDFQMCQPCYEEVCRDGLEHHTG